MHSSSIAWTYRSVQLSISGAYAGSAWISRIFRHSHPQVADRTFFGLCILQVRAQVCLLRPTACPPAACSPPFGRRADSVAKCVRTTLTTAHEHVFLHSPLFFLSGLYFSHSSTGHFPIQRVQHHFVSLSLLYLSYTQLLHRHCGSTGLQSWYSVIAPPPLAAAPGRIRRNAVPASP